MPIEIKMSGSLPRLKPMPDIMAELTNVIAQDVLADADAGGNPTWKPRIFPSGAAQLNYIGRTLEKSSTENSSSVAWGRGIPYAWIHEKGGTINHPGSTKGPIPMHTSEGLIFRWMRKPFIINMPARPIIPGIFAREKKYAEFIGSQIVMTQSEPIKNT